VIALTKLTCPNRLLDIPCTSGGIALTNQYYAHNGKEAAATYPKPLW
jgi:hypothetical protein